MAIGSDSRSAIEQRRPLWRLLHEALVLGGLWLLYTFGRALAGRRTAPARGHASQVWSLERDLRLPDEGRVQRVVLHWNWLVHAANDYYKFEHFLALVGVTVWLLLWRHRPLPRLPRGVGLHAPAPV